MFDDPYSACDSHRHWDFGAMYLGACCGPDAAELWLRAPGHEELQWFMRQQAVRRNRHESTYSPRLSTFPDVIPHEDLG